VRRDPLPIVVIDGVPIRFRECKIDMHGPLMFSVMKRTDLWGRDASGKEWNIQTPHPATMWYRKSGREVIEIKL
jgi:hypothetical protein